MGTKSDNQPSQVDALKREEGMVILLQSQYFPGASGSAYVHIPHDVGKGKKGESARYFTNIEGPSYKISPNAVTRQEPIAEWSRFQWYSPFLHEEDSLFVLGSPEEIHDLLERLKQLDMTPRKLAVEDFKEQFPEARKIWPVD